MAIINSCGFSDSATVVGGSTSLYDYFGQFVQGFSDLTFSSAFSGVTSGVEAVHRLELRKNNAYGEQLVNVSPRTAAGATGWSYHIGSLDYAGTVYYRYTLIDTSGTLDYRSGTISVMAYTPPDISAFGVTRYRYVAGRGNVPASDGGNVWVTLAATASATSGASNPATLTLQGSTVTTGSNGLNYSVTDSASLYTGSVSVSSNVQFTAIVTDKVTTVKKYVIAPADGGYFNVEKYGVAVGKRSSGYADDKMFEVAQNYRGVFRGDMSVIGDTSLRATSLTTLETSGAATFNGRIYPKDGATFSGSETHNGSEVHYGSETHSGNVTFNGNVTFSRDISQDPTWENVETVSGVNNPNGSSYGGGVLKVAKQGTHVYLRGGVGTTSGHTIGYLDFGYCPSGGDRMFLVATANARVARLRISTSGEIKCDAIYNLSDGSEPTGTLWLDCEVDYWI